MRCAVATPQDGDANRRLHEALACLPRLLFWQSVAGRARGNASIVAHVQRLAARPGLREDPRLGDVALAATFFIDMRAASASADLQSLLALAGGPCQSRRLDALLRTMPHWLAGVRWNHRPKLLRRLHDNAPACTRQIDEALHLHTAELVPRATVQALKRSMHSSAKAQAGHALLPVVQRILECRVERLARRPTAVLRPAARAPKRTPPRAMPVAAR
jgi:hypothetical protein